MSEPLRPLTQDIFDECPRYRVLVLGKSGSGKSSLINSAFNVDLANVSHLKPGKSDINEEIYSAEENAHFVLHDSEGFEAGETLKVAFLSRRLRYNLWLSLTKQQFSVVEKFIMDRKKRENLAERLHAIWLCIEIPSAGGSLLERGHELFLNLDLQGVPVVIVFTKYDKLVGHLKMQELRNGSLTAERKEEIDKGARAAYQRLCVTPLELEMAKRGHTYPLTYVSTRPTYRDTISHLIDITQNQASDSLWYIAATAQRSNIDLNIKASIAIGKNKYWRGLASSTHFPGLTLQSCLHVIHTDIIAIWNMFDPHQCLRTPEFEAMISDCVPSEPSPGPRFMTALTVAGTAASIAAAASGPIAPFVAPSVFSGVMFASWVYKTYVETPATLRLLMSYIVDSIFIMQAIFDLTTAATMAKKVRSAVTLQLVEIAVRSYKESDTLRTVHEEILAFSENVTIPRRDDALDEIIRLIEHHRFHPPELYMREVRGARTTEDLSVSQFDMAL